VSSARMWREGEGAGTASLGQLLVGVVAFVPIMSDFMIAAAGYVGTVIP